VADLERTFARVDPDSIPGSGRAVHLLPRGGDELWLVAAARLEPRGAVDWAAVRSGDKVAVPVFAYRGLVADLVALAAAIGATAGATGGAAVAEVRRLASARIRRVHVASALVPDADGAAATLHLGFAVLAE
jgi:hypothetical protein